MVSVTHLLSSSADDQTREIHRMMNHGLGEDFANTTYWMVRTDIRSLGKTILKLRKSKSEVVYAWGTAALAVAVMARCDRIIFSPDRFAGKTALRWIRALMSHGNVTMVCPTYVQQKLAVACGIKPDRCLVIQPGVDFGQLGSQSDPKLRSQLGFTDSDVLVLAVGESDEFSDHKLAVWTCGILNVLDPRYKLLIWGRGNRADSLSRLGRRMKQPDMITSAEQKLGHRIGFEALVGIADVCLVTSPGVGPTLRVATAMAGGVPIVSGVTYMLAELLEDHHTALMVPTRSPRALVQRILDLQSDETLRQKLVATATAEAYEHFSMTRMLDAYRDLLEGNLPIARNAEMMSVG